MSPPTPPPRTLPRWVSVTAFALLVSLVCLFLARWQWQRLQAREARNAQITSTYDLTPAPIADVLSAGSAGTAGSVPDGIAWTPVTATGTYEGADVLVRKRSFNEATGYWVMSALRTSSGADLWVVRGWIPAGADARTPSSVPARPTGPVVVAGHLRLSEGPADDRGLPAGQVDRIDLPALAATTGSPTYGAWVQADSETPAPRTVPQRLGPPDISDGPHFGYAVQWVIFAIGAWVGWWVILRRSRDEEFDDLLDAPAREA